MVREDLIPVKRAVTRMGTSYEQTYWVRSRELREAALQRGRDLTGPLPPREEEYQESEGEWAP